MFSTTYSSHIERMRFTHSTNSPPNFAPHALETDPFEHRVSQFTNPCTNIVSFINKHFLNHYVKFAVHTFEYAKSFLLRLRLFKSKLLHQITRHFQKVASLKNH